MKYRISENELIKLIKESVNGIGTQTDLDTQMIADELSDVINELQDSYDLNPYNYKSEEDFRETINSVLQQNKDSVNVIENFISSARQLLQLF